MGSENQRFQPGGLATAIGSFPQTKPEIATDLVFKFLPEAPTWPQLPKRDFKENMCAQFSQGMPAIVLDEENERIYFQVDSRLFGQLEKFYAKVIEDNLEYFGLSDEYALGFGYFLGRLQGKAPFPYLKGCVTGPVTFGLTITDQNRRPSLYHPELSDAITKTLAFKARWQIRRLKPYCQKIIVFVDEPYLASMGSAVVSLQEKDVVKKINEVMAAIHQEGGIAGVHCCANTDWSVLMKTEVDILSFDAYGYGKNLLLYGSQLSAFLSRGGSLAWGIVPASAEIEKEDPDTIWKRLMSYWEKLANPDLNQKQLKEACMITPSCGMGTLPLKFSEKIMQFNLQISKRVQNL